MKWITSIGLLLCLFGAQRASAYPWMIRHDYTACATCHADPSGGSLLTPYGRAQSELLMQTRYTRAGAEAEEPSPATEFLFGWVKLPEALNLSGALRAAGLSTSVNGSDPTRRVFPMQADLIGQVAVGRVRFNASAGVGSENATLPASIAGRFISRHHWVGVTVGAEESGLLRAGRMNLPFGLRNVEHPSWVRSATRTDTNVHQQHGVALAWNTQSVRAEAMLIGGNLQLAPSAYRERGYSGYLEWAFNEGLTLGVSSLATHAQRDVLTQTALWRHAHGLFGRWSPVTPLVLSFEANGILSSVPGLHNRWGHAAFVQADVEVFRGVHLIGTGETLRSRQGLVDKPAYGAWSSVAWFFAPHTDLRLDGIFRWQPTPAGRSRQDLFLLQLHTYL